MNTIKDAKNTVIQGITTKVEKAMCENNGKVPYGFVAREVATAKVAFPNFKINRDHIYHMLKKRKKDQTNAILAIYFTRYSNSCTTNSSQNYRTTNWIYRKEKEE